MNHDYLKIMQIQKANKINSENYKNKYSKNLPKNSRHTNATNIYMSGFS